MMRQIGMKQTARHPRLQMYYDSAAMNIASIGSGLSLVLVCHFGFTILSTMALGIFLVFMAGYSLWYWIGKPKNVPTSKFLSEISIFYVLYALIMIARYPVAIGWVAFAVVAAIATLLIYAVKLK